MSPAHVSSRSRGKKKKISSFVQYHKSKRARKRIRVRQSFFFLPSSLSGSRVTVEIEAAREGGGEEVEDGSTGQTGKFQFVLLTALDVGRDGLLLKLFGGDF